MRNAIAFYACAAFAWLPPTPLHCTRARARPAAQSDDDKLAAAEDEQAQGESEEANAAATDVQKPRLKVASTCNLIWCHDDSKASCYVTLHRNRAVFFVLVLTL